MEVLQFVVHGCVTCASCVWFGVTVTWLVKRRNYTAHCILAAPAPAKTWLPLFDAVLRWEVCQTA